jgi:hypothetical protein
MLPAGDFILSASLRVALPSGSNFGGVIVGCGLDDITQNIEIDAASIVVTLGDQNLMLQGALSVPGVPGQPPSDTIVVSCFLPTDLQGIFANRVSLTAIQGALTLQ